MPTQPVLIAYDGSEHADRAIRSAAAVVPERPALVLTVWSSMRDTVAAARVALPDRVIADALRESDREARAAALELAEDGASRAVAAGLPAEAIDAMQLGTAAVTIAAVAEDRRAAVVALGSRGRSAVKSSVLGSTTYGLLNRTTRPLLIAADGAGVDPRSEDGPVVVCFDGSGPARHAVDVAGALLGRQRALVVHAWPEVGERTLLRTAGHPVVMPQLRELIERLREADREDAENVAAAGAAQAASAGLDATPCAVRERDGTWEALAEVASEQRARVIVCGTRGRSSLASLVIGSVSHGLLHHAGRPVLIVPPAGEDQ